MDVGVEAMDPLPKHVAIIMDGNGRWAAQRHLPRVLGHRSGLKAVRRTLQAALDLGLSTLSLFAFSRENWKRPATEVAGLFELMGSALLEELPFLKEHSVRLRVVGEREGLDPTLLARMDDVVAATAGHERLELWLAINYSGQWHVAEACRRLLSGEVDVPPNPDTSTVAAALSPLCSFGASPPDLLIRTSGEQRISNFMLWPLAYTELYFTDVMWPDFNAACLREALAWYTTRQRRYGNVKDVVSTECA